MTLFIIFIAFVGLFTGIYWLIKPTQQPPVVEPAPELECRTIYLDRSELAEFLEKNVNCENLRIFVTVGMHMPTRSYSSAGSEGSQALARSKAQDDFDTTMAIINLCAATAAMD